MTAIVLAVSLSAAVLGCGGSGEQDLSTKQALARVDGLPQTGAVLGEPHAASQLVVFLRPDAARLTAFFSHDLPALRPLISNGRLSVLLRATTDAGAASVAGASDARTLALAAQAAGLQNQMWSFLAVVATNYVGALDPISLADLRAAVPSLDRKLAVRETHNPRVVKAVTRADVLKPRGDALRGIFVLSGAGGQQTLRATEPGRLGREVARIVSRTA